MNKRPSQILACFFCVLLCGCAVTEPRDSDVARVRSAIDADPTVTLDQLSQELGISELAVVRAMPAEHVRQWQGTPAQAWEAVQDWPFAWIKTPGMTYLGEPALVYVDAHPNTPAMKGNVFIYLQWQEISDVWLVRKPGRTGDLYAMCWFDESGDAVLRVMLFRFGIDQQTEQSLALFEEIWAQAEQPDN